MFEYSLVNQKQDLSESLEIMLGDWKLIEPFGLTFHDAAGNELFTFECGSEEERIRVVDRLNHMVEYLRNFKVDTECPECFPLDRFCVTRIEVTVLEEDLGRVSFRFVDGGDFVNYFRVDLPLVEWRLLAAQLEDFDPVEIERDWS